MLVLSRKYNEKIVIGDDIVITVLRIQGDRVRIGIEAPKGVTIHRQEIWIRDKEFADRAKIAIKGTADEMQVVPPTSNPDDKQRK